MSKACKNCKHWQENNVCYKLAYNNKICKLVEWKGTALYQVETEPDFWCKYFEAKPVKAEFDALVKSIDCSYRGASVIELSSFDVSTTDYYEIMRASGKWHVTMTLESENDESNQA